MYLRIFRNKYAFPGVVLIFLVICYQAAIKKTILAWQLNRQFRTELSRSADIGTQPGYMVRKQKNLQSIIDLYSADSNAFRSAVIARTAMIANQRKIAVSSVPMREVSLQSSQTTVERVNFSGGFFQLLQALQDMERARDVGMVRSVKFHLPAQSAQQVHKAVEMSVCLQVIKK